MAGNGHFVWVGGNNLPGLKMAKCGLLFQRVIPAFAGIHADTKDGCPRARA